MKITFEPRAFELAPGKAEVSGPLPLPGSPDGVRIMVENASGQWLSVELSVGVSAVKSPPFDLATQRTQTGAAEGLAAQDEPQR